jgi:Mrp family chromosome partitioning ATPase
VDAMNRYDRVFLDCPPVSAVSDPLILAAMSDGVIFVTKFNKIRREHARRSLQRIQDAGIRILGIALNDIDFEGRDSSYYSYYYYQNRYYASHYKNEGKSENGKGDGKSEKGQSEPAAKS